MTKESTEYLNVEKFVYAENIENLNYTEGKLYPYCARYYWDMDLGKSYHQLSYMNQQLIGREDELKKLSLFLESDGSFRVSAITGRTGNGKSSLIYQFYQNMNQNREWCFYGINYNALTNLSYEDFQDCIRSKKTLFVIDYVLTYAEEIGKWIKNLWRKFALHGGLFIRILLIERLHVGEEKPYWYIELVEHNHIEEICDYTQFIKLYNLSDDLLEKIFVGYVQKNTPRIDIAVCTRAAINIIGEIEENCKTPLFIKYIADAWMEQPDCENQKWNKEATLKYMIQKENHRIEGIFKDNEKTEGLLKILVYAIALSGINVGRKLPECLKNEWNILKNGIGSGRPNLRHIFNTFGNIDDESLCLKSNFPDALGELFCLEYLREKRYDALDEEFIEKFVTQSWEIDPRAFTGFLCRVIEDFSEHKVVSFSGILQKPSGIRDDSRVLYADILREYSYWNADIDNVCDEIIKNFWQLVNEAGSIQVKLEIYEKFAVALFNMIEYWSDTDIKKAKTCKYWQILKTEIYGKYFTPKIHRTYFYAYVIMKARLGEEMTEELPFDENGSS